MKDLGFYYVLLIFMANMHWLFLQNIKITHTFQKVLGESNLRKTKSKGNVLNK